MGKSTPRPFIKLILIAVSLLFVGMIVGCEDQSKKDAENFKEAAEAYAATNYSVAIEKFTQLAEKGHVEAQEKLGLIYSRGQGIERDWVQADKWFSIAAASGKETSVNNKKVVEVHMPPEKVAEANALAQEWLAKHKK